MFKPSNRRICKALQIEIDDQLDRISQCLKLIQDASLKKQVKQKENYQKSIHSKKRSSKESQNQTTLCKISKSQKNIKKSLSLFREDSRQNFEFRQIGSFSQKNQGDSLQKWFYDQAYIEQFYASQPISLMIETKHNWIDTYLDFEDSKVSAYNGSQKIQILRLQKGIFTCKKYSDQQLLCIQSSDLYAINNINVVFPQHNKAYHLKSHTQAFENIFQINIKEQQRIILQLLNNSKSMQRLIICKVTSEGYEAIWGNYSCQSFIQPLILQKGSYIILPLCNNNDFELDIYCENRQNIHFRADHTSSQKMLTLLLKIFSEAHFSQLLTSQSDFLYARPSFSRSCYINYGLVIEYYENIYQHQAKFIDEEPVKQDLQLLLEQIYTQRQIQNRLQAGQKIIKFYSITKKPARLFIPKKKVLMGNQLMQNKRVHTIFK